jgi:hypothetical protein
MLSVVGVSVGAPALRAEWPILKEVATFQDNCLELRRPPNNIFPSNFWVPPHSAQWHLE